MPALDSLTGYTSLVTSQERNNLTLRYLILSTKVGTTTYFGTLLYLRLLRPSVEKEGALASCFHMPTLAEDGEDGHRG